MKRGFRSTLVAAGAASALSFTGCASGEILSNHITISDAPATAQALGKMSAACTAELLDAGAMVNVVERLKGKTIIIEKGPTSFMFAGDNNLPTKPEAFLGSIASGEMKVVEWQNKGGEWSTATVVWEAGMPKELLVAPNQGSDAEMIINAACQSSVK